MKDIMATNVVEKEEESPQTGEELLCLVKVVLWKLVMDLRNHGYEAEVEKTSLLERKGCP